MAEMSGLLGLKKMIDARNLRCYPFSELIEGGELANRLGGALLVRIPLGYFPIHP
jgi:hypothetical protein